MADPKYTISKNPKLRHDEDYNFLFEAGLNHIEELSSALWTDYNEHDPGITILEALCYSITELGYRTSLPIEDLLADTTGTIATEDQTLFSAKSILTQSPLTVSDYRKLLIDIEGVSNAWLYYYDGSKANTYIGEVPIYVDCVAGTLTYTPPSPATNGHEVYLKGLYKVLLDLDNDPQLGDLNNSVVTVENIPVPAGSPTPAGTVSFSLTFPALKDTDSKLLALNAANKNITLAIDPSQKFPQSAAVNGWQVPLVVNIDKTTSVSFTVSVTTGLQVPNYIITSSDIQSFFSSPVFLSQVLNRYLLKIQKTHNIIQAAICILNANRNLCEDFVAVETIQDEEIAFCFDVDVAPGYAIEEVQAGIYVAIDNYLAPPVSFYMLNELLAKGRKIDQIFDGPRLRHGFIDTTELNNADLRTVLYASQIIAKIMKVTGVQAVRNFRMTAYDDSGIAKSDESNKPWLINLLPMRKPVLSETQSKITFYKNQFPYAANISEASAILENELLMQERKKLTGHADDLPVPVGTYFPLENYTSIEYLFPVAYGIGNTALPPTALDAHKAQTRQLKAYLLFYDQLLADFFSQLKHAGELFSTDDIRQTYFAQFISNIPDIASIYQNNTLYSSGPGESLLEALLENQDSTLPLSSTATPPSAWQQLYESKGTFADRRNRFLDHLMARFAESFNDYVFLMYSLDLDAQIETATDPTDLITNKRNFLKNYPEMSYGRNRAYNCFPQKEDHSVDSSELWNTGNVSGLEEKLCSLGGFNTSAGTSGYYRRNLYSSGNYTITPNPAATPAPAGPFQFVYNIGSVPVTSVKTYPDTNSLAADIPNFITAVLTGNYDISCPSGATTGQIKVYDNAGVLFAQSGSFTTQAAATAAMQTFISQFDADGLHLVEHMLLRPRNGNFSFPTLGPDNCCDCCGADDPYSFRISVILPCWSSHFQNMAFRDYFEQIVRREAPAHALVKICWVDPVSMSNFETAYQTWVTALATYKYDPTTVGKLESANNDLLNLLYNLYSIYPVATLHDCNESVYTNPVMLGRTALGSEKVKN